MNEGGAFAPAAGVAQAAMASATTLSALGVNELLMKSIGRLQGIDYDPRQRQPVGRLGGAVADDAYEGG